MIEAPLFESYEVSILDNLESTPNVDDLPISLRKGTCQCTLHPISKYVTNDKCGSGSSMQKFV